MSILPHQQLVIDEKAELDARLGNLIPFLSSDACHSLPFDERGRLHRQSEVMREYQCQCCYTPGAKVLLWQDASAPEAAQRVFSDRSHELVRIKPEPRKVWVGWPIPSRAGWKDYCIRPAELKREDLGVGYNWQLVEEPE
jgi:hypothetical protein